LHQLQMMKKKMFNQEMLILISHKTNMNNYKGDGLGCLPFFLLINM
jgi:hypothetical protein